MTRAISIIVNGVETQLSSLGALVSHLGWGMPPIETFSERSPGQHGDTWAGFTLGPRIGYLIFKMTTTSLDDMYALRESLQDLFSPLSAMILKFGAAGSVGVRCFNVRLAGGLDLDWDVEQWAAQKFTVALRASDPTCYDPVGVGLMFSSNPGYVVPYEIPLIFDGPSVINQLQTIIYPGNWISYPTIRITGPFMNPRIANEGTGDVLDFSGYTIGAGHYYDIDCRYGLKSVVDDNGLKHIGELTDASDLATFHMAPAREVAGGINSIRVTGLSMTGASNIQFSYFVKDMGI